MVEIERWMLTKSRRVLWMRKELGMQATSRECGFEEMYIIKNSISSSVKITSRRLIQ